MCKNNPWNVTCLYFYQRLWCFADLGSDGLGCAVGWWAQTAPWRRQRPGGGSSALSSRRPTARRELSSAGEWFYSQSKCPQIFQIYYNKLNLIKNLPKVGWRSQWQTKQCSKLQQSSAHQAGTILHLNRIQFNINSCRHLKQLVYHDTPIRNWNKAR